MKIRLSALPLLLVATAVALLPSTAPSQSVQLDSSGRQTPALSLITEDSVAEAIEQEKLFSRRYNVPAPAGENWFEVKAGKTRVLVVAGHATAQMRDGKKKGADRGTGSLALMLNKLAGTPTIYTTYESPSDPNYYDDNAFKEAVSALLRELKPVLVLDLHASRADRPYDVDLGTMHGQSLVGREDLAAKLQASLEAAGLQNISHDFFPAEKHQTITKWVSRQGVPCIQIETNTTRLAHASDNLAESERFAQLLQGLIRFIRDVDASQPN